MPARLPRDVVRCAARSSLRPALHPAVPPAVQRALMDASAASLPMPGGVRAGRGELVGVPARLYVPEGDLPDRAVLYLHGGGYVAGSPFTYRTLAARIAREAQARVYVPHYRLAPEHPFPAALDDAAAFYRGLCRVGFAPERIAVVGDSAGGGLALATALRMRDGDEPLPAVLALLSPWTDLVMSGESLRTAAPRDPLLRESWLRACVESYRALEAAKRPEISPLRADLAGLPPLVVQAGADDILVSDADRLAHRAREVGVPVEYELFEGLWHDFQLFAGMLAEADDAVEALGASMRTALAADQPADQPG